MNPRNTLRMQYHIAEYRLIAAIATLRAAQEAMCLPDVPDDAVMALRDAQLAKGRAESDIRSAKEAAEAAGVIVNTHTSLIYL